MGAIEELHPDLRGLIGRTIASRYRVDALIGEGGMGAVFRGHHLGLKRDVAIKVLYPDMVRDPEIAARFDREAHSASRLDHPNCLQVTDVGTTAKGLKFMVMQLLEGRELADILGVPIALEQSLVMTLQVIRGLEHAHEQGVVHRDIKPENVFITTDHEHREVIKLVDFGIAKLVGDAAEGQRKMTKAGLVFGTPAYMSPEQALGQEADGRADLYSAGIMLYEMVSGRPPFQSDDPVALCRMQVTNEPPPLPESVPQPVVDFIWALLAKQREDRFATATDARVVLERILPLVIPTDVMVAAGFQSSASGPIMIPGGSGLNILPSQSGPIPIGPSSSGPIPLGMAGSGPITLGRTGGITRPPHERAQTLGRVSMDPPPPRVQTPAEPTNRRWGLLLGVTAVVAMLAAGAVYMGGADDGPSGARDAVGRPADSSGHEEDDDAIIITERDDARFVDIDKLILAGKIDEADKLLGPMLDANPDDAGLVWRHGQLLSKNRRTRERALAVYGHALDLEPTLLDDKDFYAELHDLLRDRKSRDEALDIALRRMGRQGHSFLLELVNSDKPLSYNDRHRALDELATDPATESLINTRLNRALDLLQATQSLTPCGHYAAALEVIAVEPDPWYLSRVEHAPVPVPRTGDDVTAEEKADAAACEGLDDRRAAVLAMLAGMQPEGADEGGTGGAEDAPAEPVAKPAAKPKKKVAKKKPKKKSAAKSKDCKKFLVGAFKKGC
jgi:serine/threonine protein kinase